MGPARQPAPTENLMLGGLAYKAREQVGTRQSATYRRRHHMTRNTW